MDAGALMLVLGGLLAELLDSSLGMLYGTILSPVLIIAGYDPLTVVPSILLTQAVGGLVAGAVHHRLRNANLVVDVKRLKNSTGTGYLRSLRKATPRDAKVVIVVSILGVLASAFAAFVAMNVPKAALTTYIGTLVLVMGLVLITRSRFTFSWRKILAIGAISAFNKGLSGGGFGPILTAGQMISGRESRSAIGATTLAEFPICFAGFLAYLLDKGMETWDLVIYLGIGAIAGAIIGPHITAKFKSEKLLKICLGLLVTALGIWTLTKTWLL